MEIQLWSDFACPWCALGLHRLHAALRQFRHGGEVTVIHRSFELDPRAPARRAQSMEEVLVRKYGTGPEKIRAAHDRLTSLGREVGLEFHFDRVQLGSTFEAHRLAQAARGTASERAVIDGLFSAYFTEGRLLSDPDVLSSVAARAGLDVAVAGRVLAGPAGPGGDVCAAAVRADEVSARDRCIAGVPYFLINDKWAVAGAQDVETLGRVLERAWARTEAGAAAT